MTTMDFFGHQDQARRQSKRLVLLFAAAVVGIVLLVYTAAVLLLHVSDTRHGFWEPQALILVAAAVLVVVGTAAAFRTAQLRSGGPAVAQMLGGREVDPGTDDLRERTLCNVVEEMAIASGVPLPRVYVLDQETGLNAFAAGWSTGDAAITVTRGLLDQLDRDQLQGVIAHEFSHVFHGDMRLNIRLMGTLFGIVCLTTIGRILLRAGGGGGRDRRGQAGIAVFGLSLLVIGSIGVLFARLIQSAISRQREFLADASAVQYTRNPRGIGTALATIGGLGSRLRTAHAEEASHFFFANGMGKALLGMLATHPPIEERVERVLPGFRRQLGQQDDTGAGAMMAAAAAVAPATADAALGVAALTRGIAPQHLVASIGAPAQQHVDQARAVLAALPLELLAAAREPRRARAVACALLLDAEAANRDKQLQLLQRRGPDLPYDAAVLHGLLAPLPRTARLPLLELTVPALRRLPPLEIAPLHQDLRALAMADGQLTPFEFVLLKTVERHVRRPDQQQRLAPGPARPLAAMAEHTAVVMSVLARHGKAGEDAAQVAFASGVQALQGMQLSLLPAGDCTIQALDRALDALDATSPLGKRLLLTACAQTAGSDDIIEPDEAELVRAIAEHWGCPVPPLVTAAAAMPAPAS